MNKLIRQFAYAVPLIVSMLPAAQAQTWPGPNAAGYTGSSIAFNWRDLSGIGTTVVGGDDNSTSVTLPFAFSLGGFSSNSLWISTNGIVGLNAGNQSSWCCTGISNIDQSIAVGHMDWITSVSTATFGSGSNQEFVIRWSGAEFGYGTPVDMEMVLHQNSGNIEFQYNTLVNSGHNMYVGLGSSTDPLGYFAAVGTTYSKNGLLISTTAVPEPETYAMLLAGLGVLGFMGKRRKAG